MPRRVTCDEAGCTSCQDVISRTYEELLERGDDDHDAFLLCVNLLELRHPGHEPGQQRRAAATSEAQPTPEATQAQPAAPNPELEQKISRGLICASAP